jgi:hypothetical protein
MPFAVPPWLVTLELMRGHLLSDTTPQQGYILGFDNGALSVSAYSGIPFRSAAPGSIQLHALSPAHTLPGSLRPACGPTSPVRSLCLLGYGGAW